MSPDNDQAAELGCDTGQREDEHQSRLVRPLDAGASEKLVREKRPSEQLPVLYLRIDPGLKQQFKVRCAELGKSMRQVLEEFIHKTIGKRHDELSG